MADLRGQSGLKAEINVTPLVDVVLVLLIIFMVVTPLLTRGRNVQLPTATTVEHERDAHDALVVTVTADKRLFLENRQLKLDDLRGELKPRLRVRGASSVLIKADATVAIRDLRPVLRILKSERVHQISFAVLDQRRQR